jgi:hypothetical protein
VFVSVNGFHLSTNYPTGHVTHQQFNIQQLYALPTLCLCVYLRTNSDMCHLQHKLIGFYNRDEKYLQRGTDRGFKWSDLRLVYEGLMAIGSEEHSLAQQLVGFTLFTGHEGP